MIQITRTYNNTLDITDFLGEIKAYHSDKNKTRMDLISDDVINT